VQRRKDAPAVRALGSTLLAIAAAELGARLLAPRQDVPEPAPAQVDLRSYFSEQEIERGARFARGQLGLGLARSALGLGTLLLLVRRPPPVRWGRETGSIAGGAAAGAGLTVALGAVALPLSALARHRARAVGLVTQSWSGWGVDVVKATGIEAVLAAAAGAGVLGAAGRHPRGWWAPVAVGSVIATALLGALAPLILDPVWGDFTPLAEGQTRSDVLELARGAGVDVGEVYSVDASRRGTAANAYVTGLGPSQRIVLHDTLLDRYGRDEIRVVVAHELAHVRHRDVPRSVLYAAIVAPAGALAVQRLSWALSPARGTPEALPGLALCAALVAAPIGLVGNRLSRALERRADAYSLALSGAPDAFVSFERAIALQNVADLDPPRWVSSLLATHPSTGARIGAALEYKTRRAEPAPY